VEDDFRASAQSEVEGRGYYGLAGVLDGEIGLLEAIDGAVEFVPLFVLRG
jgi:hypothetical protein